MQRAGQEAEGGQEETLIRAAQPPTGRIEGRIAALIDYFVPESMRGSIEGQRRAHLFLGSHLFGPFLGLPEIAYLYVLDPAPGAPPVVMAVLIAAFWAFPWLLRATGRFIPLVIASLANLAFIILFGAMHYGGALSPFAPWLLTLPLFAFFYLGQGKHLTLAVLLGLGGATAVLYLYELLGYSMPQDMSWAAFARLSIVSVFFAGIYVTAMAVYNARMMASHAAHRREQEMRFHAIFDSTFQSTALLTADGVVLEVNRTLLDFAGLGREDVVGRAFSTIAWFDGGDAGEERLSSAIGEAASGAFVRYEIETRAPDGRSVTLDFSLKPILDERGAVSLLVAEARDITALKNAEITLREAQRVEAVGQVSAGIAHGFNNLLTGVMGHLDLLRKHVRGNEQALRLIENSVRGAVRGATMTSRLLAVGRRQALRPETVRVDVTTSRLCEELLSGQPHAIRFEIDIDPELWDCIVDSAQLEVAILNLLTNAREAMPEGGTLSVRLKNAVVGAAEAARVGVLPGEYVRLQIEDTGRGMTAEVAARAFEPFYTTKGVAAGLGLGLSQVYGFAKQSNGTAWISSTVGKGTIVSLLLPRAAQAAPQAVPLARVSA
jgi:PAS domain S-box-containing protein